MKKLTLVACLLSALFCAEKLASQQGLSDPPGRQEVAKHPLVLEGPAGPRAQTIDLPKLHQESVDLMRLAQSVAADVDQVGQGKLPKDLSEKLKQIEKLSKHLRAELAP